jgi:hypothetical protein
MFNGGHRCQAVISANRSIPVYIDWDADPTTFDLIDVGRKRSAYQFITEADATGRASASRVMLWYERRFEHPLSGRVIAFDLHEIMTEADRRVLAFDAMVRSARMTYEYTSVPVSIALAAYAIAYDMGYQYEVETFVDGLVDPSGLEDGAPAKLLADRFRKETHRSRRRTMVDDWTILVRSLNLHLEGRTVARLQLGSFWPRVAESEADFNRRRNTLSAQRIGEQHRVLDIKTSKKEAIA